MRFVVRVRGRAASVSPPPRRGRARLRPAPPTSGRSSRSSRSAVPAKSERRQVDEVPLDDEAREVGREVGALDGRVADEDSEGRCGDDRVGAQARVAPTRSAAARSRRGPRSQGGSRSRSRTRRPTRARTRAIAALVEVRRPCPLVGASAHHGREQEDSAESEQRPRRPSPSVTTSPATSAPARERHARSRERDSKHEEQHGELRADERGEHAAGERESDRAPSRRGDSAHRQEERERRGRIGERLLDEDRARTRARALPPSRPRRSSAQGRETTSRASAYAGRSPPSSRERCRYLTASKALTTLSIHQAGAVSQGTSDVNP